MNFFRKIIIIAFLCSDFLIISGVAMAPLHSIQAFERFVGTHEYVIIFMYHLNHHERIETIVPGSDAIHRNEENASVKETMRSLKAASYTNALPRGQFFIHLGSVNTALNSEVDALSFEYDLTARYGLFFFYQGALVGQYQSNKPVAISTAQRTIYKIFSEEHLPKYKNRKRSRRYNESPRRASPQQAHIQNNDNSYSFPRFGINFGWGAPCCDWPGYWYGRGPCWGNGCGGGWGGCGGFGVAWCG